MTTDIGEQKRKEAEDILFRLNKHNEILTSLISSLRRQNNLLMGMELEDADSNKATDKSSPVDFVFQMNQELDYSDMLIKDFDCEILRLQSFI